MLSFSSFARKRRNPILLTDSYKVSHWKMTPPGMTHMESFFESRGGAFPDTLFHGLQYSLKEYLTGEVVFPEHVIEAREFFADHFHSRDVFNEAGWNHIVNVRKGRLPLRIRAVQEGTILPVHNVLFTVANTDPMLSWLPNYFEPIFCHTWYPTGVGGVSGEMVEAFRQALEETGDPNLILWRVHDFGLRGSTSIESAMIGGGAHLINSRGTDTIPALTYLRDYYHEPMAGDSIPAAEHATIIAWGRDREIDAYRHILRAYPTGPLAIVSDSYDIYHACREIWGKALKDDVLARDGVLVVRPDSGYPPKVVVDVLEILGAAYGWTVNAKGYRVLHPKIRVIQGDGIDIAMLRLLLAAIKEHGWSADNLVVGSGGGLLQKINRDTQKCAMKCCAVKIDGVWHAVMKDPITDPTKRSKAGRLALIRENRLWRTVTVEEAERLGLPCEMVTVWEDGSLIRDWTHAEVQARMRSCRLN